MPNPIINRRVLFKELINSTPVPSTLLNGLVSLWPRQNNCVDVISANNGTDTNVTYTAGVNGQCAVYNTTGYSQLSAFTIPTTFTFNFWVKRNAINSRQLFFGDSNLAGNATALQFAIEFTAANKINNYIVDSAFGVSTLASSVTYTDTNWHMVTVTKSGTALKMYVDNASSATATMTLSTLNASVNAFAFGRSGVYNSFLFSGNLDECAYWNRVLTIDERTELFTEFYPY